MTTSFFFHWARGLLTSDFNENPYKYYLPNFCQQKYKFYSDCKNFGGKMQQAVRCIQRTLLKLRIWSLKITHFKPICMMFYCILLQVQAE